RGARLFFTRLFQFVDQRGDLLLGVRTYLWDRRFASLKPTRALPLGRLSAFTASLHVAPRGFTTMLNPRQILASAPCQYVPFGSKADIGAYTGRVRLTPESGHSSAFVA